MKKLTTILSFSLFFLLSVHAIPAHKGAVKLTQPDGTTVTIRLHGDEYLHFNTTDDGYTVVKNQQGYYVYAQLDANGQLEPTAIVAHDLGLRKPDEMHWLANIKKGITPTMTAENAQEKSNEQRRQAKARQKHRAANYDYNNFRGLVILIEFSDKKFSRTDYKEIMDNMINQENYTGYTATNGRKQKFVGSVRDYYSDQSEGKFQPQFDLYGPYQVNFRSTQGGERVSQILNAAINAADSEINFADYDGDGDGAVDMIYFILAGNGANYGGNDERLWWPHRSAIYDGWSYVVKDGVYLWDYASSVELYGYTAYPSTVTIDGIGTICHEFSHVLGLPDFYDADYEKSGGESHHPGEWSVMAGGSYNNYGRQPVGYSLFERYAVGFATPQLIDGEGSYTLPVITTSNTGYRINSAQNHEFFMLENRQIDNKWDAFLPGHGMLVFRVDSTSTQIWENNQVNNNPKHNYYELLRANGYMGHDANSDPFPGTRSVRSLNNTTQPANLLSWRGLETTWGLKNITENNGVIAFEVINTLVLTDISLPEKATLAVGLGLKLEVTVQPESAPCTLVWTSANNEVATVNSEGVVTGISMGETDITVTANDDPTLTATCHITVRETMEFETIAGFKTLAEGDEATLNLNNAQVLFVNGNDIYLRDSTASIVVTGYSGKQVHQDDLITGKLYGQYNVTNKIPQLIIDNSTLTDDISILASEPSQPLRVSLDSLDASHYANYLLLQKVVLQRVTTGELKGVFAQTEEHSVRIYNTFGQKGFTMPTNYQGKTYHVPGILITRVVNGNVYDELALMGPLEEVVKQIFNFDYQIGEGGAVLYGVNTLTGNGTMPLTEGENVELLVVPSENHEIDQLLLDGANIEENVVFINNASDNHTLFVSFKESNASAISMTRKANSPESAVFAIDGRPAVNPSRPGLYIIQKNGQYRKQAVGRK